MPTIEAVLVNHNTSLFSELAVRSLLATESGSDLRLTVYDNASRDDSDALRQFAVERGFTYTTTGLTTQEEENSHGELLRRFTLDNPTATHLLFLDADIRFGEPDTIRRMLAMLDDPSLYGVQARLVFWAQEALGWIPPVTTRREVTRGSGETGIIHPRPHPFCLLLRNDEVLQNVAQHVGFSCAWRFAVDVDHAGWFDTFALAHAALRAHGLDFGVAEAAVLHYANTIAESKTNRELYEQKLLHAVGHLQTLRAAKEV